MIIYAIANTVNGKRYIGMTQSRLGKRWARHCRDAEKGSAFWLHQAIRIHGKDTFVVTEVAHVLPGLGREALGELEKQIIAQEGTRGKGYNMTAGGDGVGDYNRGRKHGPSPKRGVPMSDEQRAKLRAAWARNPERKAAQVERNKRGQSVETRAKIAAVFSAPEYADALRARNAVMNKTPEHAAKISAGHARRRERIAAEQERIAA